MKVKNADDQMDQYRASLLNPNSQQEHRTEYKHEDIRRFEARYSPQKVRAEPHFLARLQTLSGKRPSEDKATYREKQLNPIATVAQES
jgi:hypothetical protein